MLRELIQNSLQENWQTKEQIANQIVSIGFGHDRSSVERTLRLLSEEGVITQSEGRPLKYRKKIKQTQLL